MTRSCERCGKRQGTVRVSGVPANRDGVIQKVKDHRYCRDCARAVGVRIPDRQAPLSDENTPPDWIALRAFYETMVRIPLTDPVRRARVAADAAKMLRVLEHFPDQPPPEFRALLERIAHGSA